uniref:FIP-RBD domain-containing protein n=1 Tax=Romanomermis culicivorax TaxID=13658 RepID=A0A915J9G4_ROMCU
MAFLDEFIGQIRLPLDEFYELYDTRPHSCWYPLKGKSGKQDEHKYIGELSIRIEFIYKENLEVPVNDRFDSLSLSSQKTNNLRGLKMAVKKAFEVSNIASDSSSKVVQKSSNLPIFNRASICNAEIPVEKEVLRNDLSTKKPDLVPDNEVSNARNGIEANNNFEEFFSTPINDNYWKRMSSFGKAGGFDPDSTFELMSKAELLDTVKKQRLEISRCLKRIRDLEDYIDQLTLRVIDAQPDLLLGPFSRASSARYPVTKVEAIFSTIRWQHLGTTFHQIGDPSAQLPVCSINLCRQ